MSQVKAIQTSKVNYIKFVQVHFELWLANGFDSIAKTIKNDQTITYRRMNA